MKVKSFSFCGGFECLLIRLLKFLSGKKINIRKTGGNASLKIICNTDTN